MKKAIQLSLCVCLFALPALGQNAATPSTTIQCRPLDGSSTPVQSDEMVIGEIGQGWAQNTDGCKETRFCCDPFYSGIRYSGIGYSGIG